MNIYCVKPRGTNIGNEVIYLGVKHFAGKYNLIRIDGLTKSSIYEMNQYGDGVIVGGGNFYENNEIEVDLNALKALQVPMFLFSLSYGRIYDRVGRLVRRTDCMPDEKIIALNEKACISSVRDIATQQYLIGLGYGAILCGCPSQFVNRFELNLPEVKSMSLLFVRNTELMSVTPLKKMEIIDEIKDLLKDDWILVCNDKRDIPFATSFGRDYIYFDDVYKYLATIKSAKKIISYRLHATIPAMAFGVPVTNICYDERSETLIQSLSEANYFIIKNLFERFLGDYCGMCPELLQHARS